MSYEYLFFYIYKSVNHSNLFTDISFWRWKCKRWWRHAGIHINIYEWHTNEWFIVTSYWFSNANYTLNWWFSRLDSIFFFWEGGGFGFHLHLQSLYKILDDDWLVRGWASSGWWEMTVCKIDFAVFINSIRMKTKTCDNNTNTVSSQMWAMEVVGSNCQRCYSVVGFNKNRIISYSIFFSILRDFLR